MSVEGAIAEADAAIKRLQEEIADWRSQKRELKVLAFKANRQGKLPLSVRAQNCLSNEFARRDSFWRPARELVPEEIATLSEAELAKMPNFGALSMMEVKSFLMEFGLRLQP